MSASTKPIMLSAVTPSNRLTLGNYLGALKPWVKQQHEHDCIFFAVDLHAITVPQEPLVLRDLTYRAIANYIAAGIDAEKALMFVQSHVPEHAELAWVLTCFTYMGELSRMTQYKEKSSKQGANIGAGIFNYPVLMASDILLYNAAQVPVGEDQKQHVEITRDVAQRMNNRFGSDLFVVPKPSIPTVGARIMSLQNPEAKMSKSDTESGGAIFLSDTDAEIEKKVKRAVTDSGSDVTYEDSKAGVKNLIDIQAAITGRTPAEIVASYAGKKYGHLKVETAGIIIEALRPIREKTDQLLADKTYLNDLLARNAERARARAIVTLERVYDRVGFIPGRGKVYR